MPASRGRNDTTGLSVDLTAKHTHGKHNGDSIQERQVRRAGQHAGKASAADRVEAACKKSQCGEQGGGSMQ